MEKVAIVILNYLNYKDTIECVESIAIDQYPAKEIIIVDNGSTNDSKAKLEEKFRNIDGLHLLFNDRNEGFARGNNIGIRYATDILGCSFVLLVNNDTIFKDPHMTTVLMEAYEPGVGVLGPRILAADGNEQNPVKYEVIRSNLKQDLYYRRKIATIGFKQSSLYKSLRKINIFKKNKNNKIIHNNLALNSISSLNLVLHGACMLLTKDYFKYYPYLFPDTFLYHEENILTILTHKVELRKKFVHTNYIYHKEDQSSEMSFSNDKSIKTKYLLDSIKLAKTIYPLNYETLISVYFKTHS
jgi:GT2 family glycosyltransferase